MRRKVQERSLAETRNLFARFLEAHGNNPEPLTNLERTYFGTSGEPISNLFRTYFGTSFQTGFETVGKTGTSVEPLDDTFLA